jgi:chromosome segregation ATPase
MSNLLNKIKGSIDSAMNKLKATSGAIQKVIKENTQFLQAENNLSKESLEGIQAFKEYAQTEKFSLGAAFESLANAMESIENARKAKTEALKAKFIGPLNEISEKYKALLIEISEADKAKKALEAAQKDLEKKKQAAAQGKGKPGEVEAAEAKLKAAQEKFEKEEGEAKAETVKFNSEKIKKIQDSLTHLIEEQKKFYQGALDKLNAAMDAVKNIDIKDAEKIVEPDHAAPSN